MKYIELQEAFELEINELDSNLTKPVTSDIEYWLNTAIDKFVKTRAFGNNFRRESFEQTQKRIDDLRTLVTTKVYNFTLHPDIYITALPGDYMFTVGETAYISSDNKCWPKENGTAKIKRADILEATVETIDRKLSNTFSEHRLHNNTARPLRLYKGNYVYLFTDGQYYVNEYELTYLRQPQKINLTRLPFSEYTDLPAATHQEIVKLAAQLFIENKGNPRYETYSNEVNSME